MARARLPLVVMLAAVLVRCSIAHDGPTDPDGDGGFSGDGGSSVEDGGFSGDGGFFVDGGRPLPGNVVVSLLGEGRGTVTSSAGPLSCASGVCAQTIADGGRATLTATPGPGSVFAGWSGACAGDGGCELVADSSKEVGARFRIPGYWSASIEGQSLSVAVTAGGDAVVLGMTQPQGPRPTPGGSGQRLFLARFTAPGVSTWATYFGGPMASVSGGSLAIGPTGDLFLTAGFSGVVDVGTGPIESQSGTDILVAAFTPDGLPRWAKRFGGASSDAGVAIAVDGQGNLLVLGQVGAAVQFGSFTVPGPSGPASQSFLVKLSSDGTPLWATGFALTSSALASDAAGNVWVAGQNLFNLVPSFQLLHFDARGNRLWSRNLPLMGPDAETRAAGVAVDASGTATMVGQFVGSADFGAGPVSSFQARSLFAARYRADGGFLSVRSWQTGLQSLASGVAADGRGNVQLAGWATLDGPLDPGGGDVAGPAGTQRAFFARYSPEDQALYSHGFGAQDTNASTQALAVSANASGVTAVAGFFNAPVDFGDATRTPPSFQATFVQCFPAPP